MKTFAFLTSLTSAALYGLNGAHAYGPGLIDTLVQEHRETQQTDVAFAAGFGSVRQFNDAFRRTFHASPTDVRRGRPAGPAAVRVALAVRQPFAPEPVLDWMALHDIPGRTGVADGAVHHTTDEQVVSLRPVMAGGTAEVAVEVLAVEGHDPDLGRAVALARQVNCNSHSAPSA